MSPNTRKQVENIAYGSDLPFAAADDNPGSTRRSSRPPKPVERPGFVDPDDYNDDFTEVVPKGRGRAKRPSKAK